MVVLARYRRFTLAVSIALHNRRYINATATARALRFQMDALLNAGYDALAIQALDFAHEFEEGSFNLH